MSTPEEYAIVVGGKWQDLRGYEVLVVHVSAGCITVEHETGECEGIGRRCFFREYEKVAE